jgi:hypothetical protein
MSTRTWPGGFFVAGIRLIAAGARWHCLCVIFFMPCWRLKLRLWPALLAVIGDALSSPLRSPVALRLISLAILIPISVVLLGASGPTIGAIASAWRDRDVTIDGLNTEWQPLSSFGQESRYSIALLNDAENLYVVLATNDPATGVQMLTQGLIVWFDPEGGTKKRFGLKYPVGTLSYGVAEGRAGGAGRGSPRRQDRSAGPVDRDEAWSQAEADGRLNRLEVLGPGSDDRRSLVVDKSDPIAVKIGRHDGTVVYELRIPIAKNTSHEFTLGVSPGKTIGIGLETAERERGPGGMRLGGGPSGGFGGAGGPGGGFGGGRGGGGGSDDRGGGAGRLKPPKPLNAWVTARLSTSRSAP